jgi:hypothetical protein
LYHTLAAAGSGCRRCGDERNHLPLPIVYSIPSLHDMKMKFHFRAATQLFLMERWYHLLYVRHEINIFHRNLCCMSITAFFSVNVDNFLSVPLQDDCYCARYDFIIIMSQIHMPTLLDGNEHTFLDEYLGIKGLFLLSFLFITCFHLRIKTMCPRHRRCRQYTILTFIRM